jgi:hypothetical protein
MNGMKTIIKRILRESDFDWTKEIPSEDDNAVYLVFSHGKPDWEFDMDGELVDEEYTSITGSNSYTTKDNWEEWNVYEDNEGVELLDYFYKKGFHRKQPQGHDTSFDEGESDGSFSISNRDYFCKHVGNYHPKMCGLPSKL